MGNGLTGRPPDPTRPVFRIRRPAIPHPHHHPRRASRHSEDFCIPPHTPASRSEARGTSSRCRGPRNSLSSPFCDHRDQARRSGPRQGGSFSALPWNLREWPFPCPFLSPYCRNRRRTSRCCTARGLSYQLCHRTGAQRQYGREHWCGRSP